MEKGEAHRRAIARLAVIHAILDALALEGVEHIDITGTENHQQTLPYSWAEAA